MHCLRWALIVAWVGATPMSAWAQDASVSVETSAALLNDPALADERARLSELLRAGDDPAWPQQVLVAKVREGLTKRVPAARIVQALASLRERVGAAERLLADAPRTPVADRASAWIALVDGMSAGLSEAEMATVLRALGGAARELRTVREVALTMAELAERGFGRSAVVTATMVAWQQGGRTALPALIVAATQIDARAQGRDAALSQQAHTLRAPNGLSRAPGQQGRVHEPGPPHDDAFGKAAQRGRGLAKGRNR